MNMGFRMAKQVFKTDFLLQQCKLVAQDSKRTDYTVLAASKGLYNVLSNLSCFCYHVDSLTLHVISMKYFSTIYGRPVLGSNFCKFVLLVDVFMSFSIFVF